eukprot:EG_transcript_9692
MPDVLTFSDRNADPTWHSGLKTLPKPRYPTSPEAINPRVFRGGPPRDRWDVETTKTLHRSQSAPPRRAYVRDGEWSSGLKTLHADHVAVKKVDRIEQIAARNDHGAVRDWEYTGTLHKTLEQQRPKPGYESWFTENYKVLSEEEARRRAAVSPHQVPGRLLETQTIPTAKWSAGEKVVPANRLRRYMTNNQSDLSFRTDIVQRPEHVPADGSWLTENFKVVQERRVPVLRPHADEWEGGQKVVPKSEPRTFHDPRNWNEENRKTLRPEQTHNPTPYRFVIDNTGWDSAHFKTFDPPDLAPSKFGPRARVPYALANDWYVDGKAFPAQEQHPSRRHKQYIHAGSGWDSGLKAFPREEALAVDSPSRWRVRGQEHWDVQNRKTLPWEVTHSASPLGERYRVVGRVRAENAAHLNSRIGQTEVNAYSF